MMKEITSDSLQKDYNWGSLVLRPYQLEGVNWLLQRYTDGHGCILGDEMGLGKTCQTIAMLTVVTQREEPGCPHLVVCPRSLLENWEQEFEKFSPTLKVLLFVGDKEARFSISEEVKKSKSGSKYNFDVLLTTYEMCLKDYLFLKSISWNVLVVDEGHRLKNHESLLYKTLEEWDISNHILLTGTPVQNSLRELYALLSFVDSSQFKLSRLESFVKKYSSQGQDVDELHQLLKPYLLRRTKVMVLPDLPQKSCVVLYHGLSTLQKKLYKAILIKDTDVFESNMGGGQTRLMNILMQLRKCVNHPYLFDGVEPEPFELGEHLIDCSHKLVLIDRLLTYLWELGHKVLLFSQMSRMLDILQDYLGYRGYTYERLDGSVRGEERFLAVKNFNETEATFVFLLSTKAGGQGLNLMSADTVIFVDSDFNPQNDLQAAARAHRIGQHRPVKVIRLIGQSTVEEIILRRAEEKLSLTERVIEKGEFVASSASKLSVIARNNNELQEILKFGVDELLADVKANEPVDFETVLGRSSNGQWVVDGDDLDQDEEKACSSQGDNNGTEETSQATQSMYMFEGLDYSKTPSAADIKAFNNLIQVEKASSSAALVAGERSLRRAGTSVSKLFSITERKPQKQLSPEELEERRRKREETAERKAKQAQEREVLRVQAQKKKREELWRANGYESLNITLDIEGKEEEEDEAGVQSLTLEDDDDDDDDGDENKPRKKLELRYVVGDVTRPVDSSSPHIIVHCTDDSGSWGRGGLFSAISLRTKDPQIKYELAGEMKDLNLGDCHLIPINSIHGATNNEVDYVALVVAQARDKRTHKLSGIKLPALKLGLQRIFCFAKSKMASVHLPRIGHDTPSFNWYGTERILRKHLASRGIPTHIYYFSRKSTLKRKYEDPMKQQSKVQKMQSQSASTTASSSSSAAAAAIENFAQCNSKSSSIPESIKIPCVFSGLSVVFHNIPLDKLKHLKRFVLAYDGDVEKLITPATTHLIANPETSSEELKMLVGNCDCTVVSPLWVEDCIMKKRVLPHQGYVVPHS